MHYPLKPYKQQKMSISPGVKNDFYKNSSNHLYFMETVLQAFQNQTGKGLEPKTHSLEKINQYHFIFQVYMYLYTDRHYFLEEIIRFSMSGTVYLLVTTTHQQSQWLALYREFGGSQIKILFSHTEYLGFKFDLVICIFLY